MPHSPFRAFPVPQHNHETRKMLVKSSPFIDPQLGIRNLAHLLKHRYHNHVLARHYFLPLPHLPTLPTLLPPSPGLSLIRHIGSSYPQTNPPHKPYCAAVMDTMEPISMIPIPDGFVNAIMRGVRSALASVFCVSGASKQGSTAESPECTAESPESPEPPVMLGNKQFKRKAESPEPPVMLGNKQFKRPHLGLGKTRPHLGLGNYDTGSPVPQRTRLYCQSTPTSTAGQKLTRADSKQLLQEQQDNFRAMFDNFLSSLGDTIGPLVRDIIQDELRSQLGRTPVDLTDMTASTSATSAARPNATKPARRVPKGLNQLVKEFLNGFIPGYSSLTPANVTKYGAGNTRARQLLTDLTDPHRTRPQFAAVEDAILSFMEYEPQIHQHSLAKVTEELLSVIRNRITNMKAGRIKASSTNRQLVQESYIFRCENFYPHYYHKRLWVFTMFCFFMHMGTFMHQYMRKYTRGLIKQKQESFNYTHNNAFTSHATYVHIPFNVRVSSLSIHINPAAMVRYTITRPVGRLKNFIQRPNGTADEDWDSTVRTVVEVFQSRAKFVSDTVFCAWHLLGIYLRSEADTFLDLLNDNPSVMPPNTDHRYRKGLTSMCVDACRIIAMDGNRHMEDQNLWNTYIQKLKPTMMSGYQFPEDALLPNPPVPGATFIFCNKVLRVRGAEVGDRWTDHLSQITLVAYTLAANFKTHIRYSKGKSIL
ncbi:uncharacterized protein EV422DRAFT_503050 [Fimicolochytrium jonesii]|uniref:uncharacterized protein n=1 Tax=Fimicolochytrium jonesii TaxID=1396493 RepID=UPI0022FE4ABC|nr:uncharacterized protein EV422DRAFT_503050 [Fimicolochytrium jonesii]KAI8825659.1 hypothetical protein EV422DRAFT_503050 [Fimicolochytrium jonesii]